MAGSTSTRAMPIWPSSGSRSHSTSRRTISLPSTTWSASAVRISRPAATTTAQWQERALAEHPSAHWVHRTLCPAYVLGGAKLEAQRSLAALQDQYPDLTLPDVQKALPPMSSSYCNRLFDALRTVGLPA